MSDVEILCTVYKQCGKWMFMLYKASGETVKCETDRWRMNANISKTWSEGALGDLNKEIHYVFVFLFLLLVGLLTGAGVGGSGSSSSS